MEGFSSDEELGALLNLSKSTLDGYYPSESDSSDTSLEISEDSAFSNDEDEELSIFASYAKRLDPIPRPKVDDFMETVVAYSEEEFRRNFRLKRAVAIKLIEKFLASRHYSKNCTHGGKEKLSAEVIIHAFLWFAGNKCCIRDTAGRFGVSESSFHRQCERVLDFFVDISPEFIHFPYTYEEKQQLADRFEKISSIPAVIGCIDGTYIPIMTPVGKIRSTYVNRHDGISVTAQAICDPDLRFLDIFTGVPSKIHDARIFRLSFIYDKLRGICEGKYHIWGDGAYPISSFLLTPYRDTGNLSHRQKRYNKQSSSTRVKIENAFGLLKQRFRQLRYLEFQSVNKTSKFILSCCVLHNLCIDEEDIAPFDDGADELQENITNGEYREDVRFRDSREDNLQRNLEKREGELKRDRIAADLIRR